MNQADNGRITVSKDFLRAELVGMELRLVDKLATKAEVEALQAKHESTVARVDVLETEVDRLKNWRRALASAAAAVVAVVVAFTAQALHHLFG